MTTIKPDLGSRLLNAVTELADVARDMDPTSAERTQYTMRPGSETQGRSAEVAKVHSLLHQVPEGTVQRSPYGLVQDFLGRLPKSVSSTLNQLISQAFQRDNKITFADARTKLAADLQSGTDIQVKRLQKVQEPEQRQLFECKFKNPEGEQRQFNLVIEKTNWHEPIVIIENQPVWHIIDTSPNSSAQKFRNILRDKGITDQIVRMVHN